MSIASEAGHPSASSRQALPRRLGERSDRELLEELLTYARRVDRALDLLYRHPLLRRYLNG